MRILICGDNQEDYGYELKADVSAVFGMLFWKTLQYQTVVHGATESIGAIIDDLAEEYGWSVVARPLEEEETSENQNVRLIEEEPDMVLYFIRNLGNLRWAPTVQHLVKLAQDVNIPVFDGREVSTRFMYEDEE